MPEQAALSAVRTFSELAPHVVTQDIQESLAKMPATRRAQLQLVLCITAAVFIIMSAPATAQNSTAVSPSIIAPPPDASALPQPPPGIVTPVQNSTVVEGELCCTAYRAA